MIVFLGFFSAIALLALIVYALHKFQQKEKKESVDRNSPLPPLPLQKIFDDSAPGRRRIPENKNWQLLVRNLKDGGQIRQALDVCICAYPQMGAFKQACVLLRAEVREAKRRGTDPHRSLSELYKTSAMAAFFHGKIAGSAVIPASAFKNLRYGDFEHLSMPYKELGYVYLKLLTPTDIKVMEEVWGAPDSHRHVREFHEVAWQQVLTHFLYQSGLP